MRPHVADHGRVTTGESSVRTPRFLISLDFELMWGVRETRAIESYGPNILGAREAIPKMLALFGRHGVKVTWATVGMLLFDNKRDLLGSLPDVRPTYENARLDPYGAVDAVGADEKSDPFHFGLSLAARILEHDGMELASHTFSHFYALERGQTRAQFASDLDASVRAITRIAEAPRSLVFPRNQVNPDYLDVCSDAGFTAYRGNEASWIFRRDLGRKAAPVQRALRLADGYVGLTGANTSIPARVSGIVDLPSSRFLRPYESSLRPLERLRVHRITSAMEAAARSNGTFHLWWHPHNFGANLAANLAVLTVILEKYAELRDRYGMRSQTMAEAAAEASG